MLTPEKRLQLENEWKEVCDRLNGDFPTPKDMRRKDEITSLLMTDGQTEKVKFNFVRPKQSNRVTSFTKNRR